MVLAEDLRQAVLQAAIQGKLTERNAADTSIQNTLLEISDKRKYLDIDRKLLVSKEIDLEEVPFEVPKTWTWIRLGSICEVITKGSSPKWQGINYTENGLLFVTSENVGVEKLLLSERKYVEEKFDEISPRSSLKNGDLLTNIVGASIGRTALYDLEEKANINQAVCIIRLVNKEFAPYVMKYMNSNTAYKIMMEDKVETARPNISLTNISDFLIPLPPIEEQQRIVDKINEIMPKIDEYEKIEKELEVLKKEFPIDMKDALLQAAMQGKLTAQLESDSSVDELLAVIKVEKEKMIAQKKIKKEKSLSDIEEEEIPFDIPENWRWVRWGNLAYSIQYGYNAPAQESGRIKMVRISDIQDNSVNWDSVPYCDISDEELETYLLKENDILFARTGGTVGKSFLVRVISGNAIYAGYLIRTRYSNQLVPKYLKLFMESQLYWVQLQNGKTQGCQPNCNGQTLSKMIIPLPPIEEQQRIVERLDTLLPLCEDLKEE